MYTFSWRCPKAVCRKRKRGRGRVGARAIVNSRTRAADTIGLP